TAYNLAETIGGVITLLGVLLLFGDLVRSYPRDVPAGHDPWHGPTPQGATTPPPPPDNDTLLPTRRGAHPNSRPAAAAVGPLEHGHLQIESSFVDAELQEIVEMPHSSPWPIVLAVWVSGMFAVLAVAEWDVALVFAVLALLTLVAWHWGDAHGTP